MKRPTKSSASKRRQPRGGALAVVETAASGQIEADASVVVHDVGALIDAARQQVSIAANAGLTGLYWQIGRRVHAELLQEQRAAYGAQHYCEGLMLPREFARDVW